jgi:hypothetical protein
MTPRRKVPFYTKIDPDLKAALRRFKDDVGVPEAQQIDRALRAWLGARGVKVTGRHGKIGEAAPDVLPPRERRVKRVKR